MVNGYPINGAEVNGEVTAYLYALPGNYTFQVKVAGLLHGRALLTDDGSYSLVGHGADFKRGYVAAAQTAPYIFNGSPANSVRGYQLQADGVPFLLVGKNAELREGFFSRAYGRDFEVPREIRLMAVHAEGAFTVSDSSRRIVVPSENRAFQVRDQQQFERSA